MSRTQNVNMQSENIDYRVFVLNSYSGQARKIICYVSKNNIITGVTDWQMQSVKKL